MGGGVPKSGVTGAAMRKMMFGAPQALRSQGELAEDRATGGYSTIDRMRSRGYLKSPREEAEEMGIEYEEPDYKTNPRVRTNRTFSGATSRIGGGGGKLGA
jgi:hypothetical protein